MRVVIRAAPRAPVAEAGLAAPRFEPLPRRKPSFLYCLTASFVLHGAVLETTPGIVLRAEYWRFRPPEVERAMAQASRPTPLLVRVPETAPEEKLYFQPSRRPAPAERSRPSKAAAASRVETPREAPAQDERPAALVLQPGRKAAPPKRLPPLKAFSVWSGANPRLIEEPILPGAREAGREPSPAGRSVNFEPPVPAPPLLPSSSSAGAALDRARVYLPPSGSSPLSSRRQWMEDLEIPIGAANPGTPAAFIILTPDRPKPGETIAVPPGNIVVLGSGAGRTPAGSPPQQTPPDRAAEAAAVENNGAAAARNGRMEIAAAAKNGLAGRQKSDGAESTPEPGVAKGGLSAPSAEAAPGSGAGTVSRTIHTASGDIFAAVESDGSMTLLYPAGGAFDVVVVDAALPQAIASHTAALSGNPVYTAYLNVGQPVEWVLHYCLPGGEGGVRRQHSVVTLSAPKPLKAPYVVEAHLPPEPLWRWPRHQVFHALLSVSGRLERLRILQAGEAGEVLLDSLRRWTFRPALLDGVPAATEVLLVIPPFRQNP